MSTSISMAEHRTADKWSRINDEPIHVHMHMEDFAFVYPPKILLCTSYSEAALPCYGCAIEDALIVLNGTERYSVLHLCY